MLRTHALGAFLIGLGLTQAAILQFDTASIKPRAQPMRGYNLQVLPGGKLRALNVTLKQLIQEAYHLHPFQIEGPASLDRLHYDVLAEPAQPDFSGESDVRLRLQTLLAARFQLQVHRATKEGHILVLTVDKGGPKFHDSETPNCTPPGQTKPCGGFDVRQRSELTGYAVTPAQLADMLSFLNSIQINDETGLTGKYDMHLQWTPDNHLLVAAEGANAPPPDPNRPGLFTAIKEQLGLRLVSRKGPVNILVVDRAAGAVAN